MKGVKYDPHRGTRLKQSFKYVAVQNPNGTYAMGKGKTYKKNVKGMTNKEKDGILNVTVINKKMTSLPKSKTKKLSSLPKSKNKKLR